MYSLFMNQWQKIRGHLKTINAHKRKVMELCFRCGLIKQGLKHDLSKYSPTELKTGFKYYQGFRSPIDAQKEDNNGVSVSWLHHKGRNMHHWEFWLDGGKQGIHPVPMPFNYVAEMFCDRVAASMIYQKDKYTDDSAWNFYLHGRPNMMLHPQTKEQLEFLLKYLAYNGLDASVELVRKLLKEYRSTGKVTLPDIEMQEPQDNSDHIPAVR